MPLLNEWVIHSDLGLKRIERDWLGKEEEEDQSRVRGRTGERVFNSMLRSPIPDSWVGSSLLNLYSRTLDWRDESKGWDWRFITLAVLISLDSSKLCRQRLVALEVHELTSYERDLESTESLLERLVCVSWRNASWSTSVVVPSAPDQWHSLISFPRRASLIVECSKLRYGINYNPTEAIPSGTSLISTHQRLDCYWQLPTLNPKRSASQPLSLEGLDPMYCG